MGVELPFERKIVKQGGSLTIILPRDICNYLKLDDGTEIRIAVQEGKFGKFISFWRKDQKNGI